MFSTPEYIKAEVAYRHERIASDWSAARRAHRPPRSSRALRLPRRPALLLRPHRARGATLA